MQVVLISNLIAITHISRGGLCTPSGIIFITTLHAHELYYLIFYSISLKEQLLASNNPRSVFIKVFINKMQHNETQLDYVK